ncbi:MAG: hypothetical protein PQJ59_09885 [Spirochaetales bacterium]|nr:hypothetical protein [Spirochaetales bacterium]
MVKKVLINGHMDTLLVLSDESELFSVNPYLDALNEQEERIEALERQNKELMEQGDMLINLVSTTLEARSSAEEALESLKDIESFLMALDEELSEEQEPATEEQQ